MAVDNVKIDKIVTTVQYHFERLEKLAMELDLGDLTLLIAEVRRINTENSHVLVRLVNLYEEVKPLIRHMT